LAKPTAINNLRPAEIIFFLDDIANGICFYIREMNIHPLPAAILSLLFVLLYACTPTRLLLPHKTTSVLSGTQFYQSTAAMGWQQRDSIAIHHILQGDLPSFLQKLVPVVTSIRNEKGKTIKAIFYVTPDYLSIGTNDDWARIPLTPMAAQQIADSFQCFLPTRKMVDDIYHAATVKLAPMPMFAFRDSTVTMYQHHLMIEGQRKGRTGLIAGIKKDVVISGKVERDMKKNRVAIYGWHQLDGKAIQPLYTGHVNWYVDYSHAIRLVYRKIRVSGKWMDYTTVLQDPVLKKLLCDEDYCDFYRYVY